MKALFFLALLSFAGAPAGAKVRSCADNFEKIAEDAPRLKTKKEIKRVLAEVEARLGFVPDYRISEEKIELFEPGAGRVGYLDFIVEKKTLEVDYLSVNAPYRRQGVSEALLAVALRENPKVKKIETEALASTNGDFLEAALKRGLSCEEAIRTTPAYRMRARLGFSKILEAECAGGSFTAAKPEK
jgi:GNAT superfamily N-acetyltransferase